jgi:WD40 repeat protein
MKYLEVAKQGFQAAAFDPDGRWLVTLHSSGYLRFWDWPEFEHRLSFQLPIIPSSFHRLSLLGRHLVMPGYYYDIGQAWDRLRSTESGKPKVSAALTELQGRERYSLVLLAPCEARGWLLARIMSGTHQFRMYDFRRYDPEGRSLQSAKITLDLSGGIWEDMAVSPDGLRLAGCGHSGVTLLETDLLFLAQVQEPIRLEHTDAVRRMCFSPNGRFLATAAGRTPWLWDLSTDPPSEVRFPSFGQFIERLAFHPRGHQFAAGSRDGGVRVYDTAGRKEVLRLDLNIGEIRGLAFAPDGMTALAAGLGKRVAVWDVD